MQQPLNLLYLNHKGSLAYPENKLPLQPGLNYLDAQEKSRRAFLMDPKMKPVDKPSDILKKYEQKRQELLKSPKKKEERRDLSKKQDNVVKKYFVDFKSLQKRQQHLPTITHNHHQIGQTTRAFQSDATRFIQKDRTQLSTARYVEGSERGQSIEIEKIKKAESHNNERISGKLFKLLKQEKQKNEINFEDAVRLVGNLNNIIYRQINNYYSQQLFNSLSEFGKIVRNQIKNNKFKPTKNVIANISSLSSQLKATSVRTDVLIFLTLITTEDYHLPNNYFTQFELDRLEFRENSFRLKNVTEDQVKMIVGMFLLVRVFCNNIFYQHWNVQFLELPKKVHKRVRLIISQYTSFFFAYAMKSYQKLQIFPNNLKMKGVVPVPMVDESPEFYYYIYLNFESTLQKISAELRYWINKISYHVIKNREKTLRCEIN